MHIAASNPLSIDKHDLNKEIIKKRRKLLKRNLKIQEKKEIIEKISSGKIKTNLLKIIRLIIKLG